MPYTLCTRVFIIIYFLYSEMRIHVCVCTYTSTILLLQHLGVVCCKMSTTANAAAHRHLNAVVQSTTTALHHMHSTLGRIALMAFYLPNRNTYRHPRTHPTPPQSSFPFMLHHHRPRSSQKHDRITRFRRRCTLEHTHSATAR